MSGHWRFGSHGDSSAVGSLLTGFHDPWLVALSVGVAVLAAFTALAVGDRILATRRVPLARNFWLLAGAATMGGGIWAMHFIGMLAFVLPVPVTYDVGMTLVSMVPAVIGSGVALLVMSRESVGWLRLQTGGLLMAIAIGTMHYLGMEAMRLDAAMAYDPALFALSLIVAHLLATTALYVRFRLARGMQSPVLVSTAALVLGGAVAAMHYTAMEAATFHAGTGQLGGQTALPSVVLAGAVCVLVLLTLGLTILSTVVHTRLTSVSVSLAEGARRHATVLQTMADGLLTFDADGRIESTNPASQRIFG